MHLLKYKSDLFFLLLILGISVLFSLKFLSSNIGFDEGVFVWTGSNLLKGEIPYKDFLEIKPVVIFFANAIGLFVFGTDNFKLFPFFITLTSIITLYLGLRKLGIKPPLSFLLTLYYSSTILSDRIHITLNDTETYGLSFAIIGTSLLFWNLQHQHTTRRDFTKFLAGIFFALSVLSKEPFALAIIPIILLSFLYFKNYNHKFVLTHLGSIIIGGTMTLAIVFIYLLYNQALTDYFNLIKTQFLYIKTYSSQSYSVSQILYLIYYRYNSPITLATLLPFYLAFLHKYKWGLFSLASIIGITLGLYGISLGHNYFDHYFLIGVPSLLLPAIFGALHLSHTYPKLNPKKKKTVAAFCSLCFIFPLSSINYSILTSLQTTPTKPNYYPEPKVTQIINQYSSKEDYILLKDNPFLYVVWNRKHPFKWSCMLDQLIVSYNGSNESEKLSALFSEIEINLPKVIYIPPSKIKLEQSKHLNQVVYPLIAKYNYSQIYPDLYVLPR